MLREGELNLIGDTLKFFNGDIIADGASDGEKFSIGVDVIALLKFVLEMSPRTLDERDESVRERFTDRFAGDPVPGTDKRPIFVSMKISFSLVNRSDVSSILESSVKAGLHGRFSSRQVRPRSGVPTSWRTLSRCKRKLVFGDTDGGGLIGGFSFTAGVRGGSI